MRSKFLIIGFSMAFSAILIFGLVSVLVGDVTVAGIVIGVNILENLIVFIAGGVVVTGLRGR